jgi:hypothetical protein
MADNEHGGGAARLQAAGRPEAFFQETVVTFDAIGAVAASRCSTPGTTAANAGPCER